MAVQPPDLPPPRPRSARAGPVAPKPWRRAQSYADRRRDRSACRSRVRGVGAL